MSETIRLGGMALANGVLVHGPEHWACAVRTDDGEVKVASGRKTIRSRDVAPFLRGPAKMAEVFALLPAVRRKLPEAKLPFERPAVAASLFGSAFAIRGLRGSSLAPAFQEALAALLAVAPTAVALRGSELAEYHGAEHISIGSYERAGAEATRVHERCGSHLVGPLLVTSAAASFLARRAPTAARPLARLGAAVGALGAAVEVFGWMVRNERHPLARALAKPGRELQARFVTAEPSAEQLEVAEAALAECLRLEGGADGDRGALPEATPA